MKGQCDCKSASLSLLSLYMTCLHIHFSSYWTHWTVDSDRVEIKGYSGVHWVREERAIFASSISEWGRMRAGRKKELAWPHLVRQLRQWTQLVTWPGLTGLDLCAGRRTTGTLSFITNDKVARPVEHCHQMHTETVIITTSSSAPCALLV